MKNPQKVAFEFLAFSANFVLLKLTYLVTLFECKRSLLRSQWDFFCDFQTPCNTISLLLLISVLFCKYQTNKTSFTNHWFFFYYSVEFCACENQFARKILNLSCLLIHENWKVTRNENWIAIHMRNVKQHTVIFFSFFFYFNHIYLRLAGKVQVLF